MNKKCFNKGLVIAVILLFIGVAFAPSINANVSNNELVEVTTEFCGIEGMRPQTMQLTNQESIELETLINEFKSKLDSAETKEETVEIYNNVIIKLDKLGVLGDLTVEQAQELVTGMYKKSQGMKFKERIVFKQQNEYNINKNFLCLVSGRTNYTFCVHRLNYLFDLGFWLFLAFGYALGYTLINSLCEIFPNFAEELFIIGVILWLSGCFTILMAYTYGMLVDMNPVSLFNMFGVGFYYYMDGNIWYSPGWVRSIGLFGEKNWEGELLGNLPGPKINRDIMHMIRLFPAIWGFNGIKIWLNKDGSEKFYLGSALAVGFDVKE